MKCINCLLSAIVFLVASSSLSATPASSSVYSGVTSADSTLSYIPYYASKILLTDSLSGGLSGRAKAIIGRPFTPIPDHYSTADTLIYSPLFFPLIFDVEKMSNPFPRHELDKLISLSENPLKVGKTLEEYAKEQIADSLLQTGRMARYRNDFKLFASLTQETLLNNIDDVRLTTAMLPEPIKVKSIEASGDIALNIKEVPIESADPNALEKKTVDRVYWIKKLESTLHFAQNHLSDNWYKGGNSSLNLNMRTYANFAYNKDRVKWVNELESKLGFFNSTADPISKFRITDDMLRIVSNFGVKAIRNWYYTLDAQFRTQMLVNRNNEGKVVTRPFAPFYFDGGPGVKCEFKRQFDDPFKKLTFTTNISPISVTYIYTYSDDIDKRRVGLLEDQRQKVTLGTTIRSNLNFDISQTVNWQSRFFYNTSYKNLETEFENTLSIALTKYFSTRINLNLRFDDSIIMEEKTLKNMLQYNELFSFGFAYKL